MGFDFSMVAARYAAYRPRYPAALVDALAERCDRHDLAWDAGCGSGQLSVALAARFTRVIATDPSQAQLDAAERHAGVEYRRGAAEDGVDGECDLAIAAQAAHWFEWPRFVAAVARGTRPGALVGVVSYGRVVLAGEVGAVLDAFYDDTIASYWPPERAHVHDHYAALNWPWPAVAAPALAMTETWTRDELLGYVSTWSAVARFVAANGPTAVDALATRLATLWPDDERRAIAWPLTIKLARR